ncbi:MAG: hypothetical protein V7K89_00265 [Nostoc sp.]|uniref:hypothetical protein n=1 Tax=Nostoc sp. TaxID=1180 RepID=UPI002FFC0DFA
MPGRSPWNASTVKAAVVVAKVVKLPKRQIVAQPETVSEIPGIVILEYEVVEWSATEGLKDTHNA